MKITTNSISMHCICCNTTGVNQFCTETDEYYCCRNCGLVYLKNSEKMQNFDFLRKHYQKNDPHKEVSSSKTFFYQFVLNYLASRIKGSRKRILDIGCGYGYFLEMASKKGWEPTGIEVVHDAVKSSRKRVGSNNIFQCKLKESCLSENFFDAITLWDVIAIADNPYDELRECYRLLKKGGIIGIRTRNVLFQMCAFRFFCLIKKIALSVGLKEFYVFNKYCFSGRAIYALLYRTGFINIRITNSPLTFGDPYNHLRSHYFIKLAKTYINFCSKFISLLTHGRWLLAPSLLIWAEKP